MRLIIANYESYYTNISLKNDFFFRNFQNDFPALFAQQHGAIHTSIDSSGPPLVTGEFESLKIIQKKKIF